MMPDVLAVILAAGQGTRMKSKIPKVLHQVAGRAMIDYVAEAARSAGASRLIVVVGHEAERVREYLASTNVEIVEQNPQLGTGHALQQALQGIRTTSGPVLVLNGDAPLIEADLLRQLFERHAESGAQITLLTAEVEDAQRLGRVVRHAEHVEIVEWADATEQQRQIREVNAGVYCFEPAWLATELTNLTLSAKGEYYLTELVGRASRTATVLATSLASCVGVDTLVKLADAERIVQERLRAHWMSEGVRIVDPPSVFLDTTTRLGADTVIYPNTSIEHSEVGEECVLGPGTQLRAAHVGKGCVIQQSIVEESTLEDAVHVGPFSHLRPGSYVERGAHLGNYVETKNARIGQDTQIHHVSYTGDARLGRRVNIGAGTITCNFNSETGVKSETVVEDDASLGSDSMLVAPVVIGAGAMTGAGAVVTRDVPAGALAVGAPARVLRKVKGAQE